MFGHVLVTTAQALYTDLPHRPAMRHHVCLAQRSLQINDLGVVLLQFFLRQILINMLLVDRQHLFLVRVLFTSLFRINVRCLGLRLLADVTGLPLLAGVALLAMQCIKSSFRALILRNRLAIDFLGALFDAISA